MLFFYISLIILLIGGLFCLIVPEKVKSVVNFIFYAVSFPLILVPSIEVLTKNTVLSASFSLNSLFGPVNIVIDPLSAFFVVIISLVGLLACLYSIGYMKPYIKERKRLSSHYFFQNVLIISMLLVVTLQNAFAFLIAWELMSLSSFFLVIFESEKEEVIKAGMNYLISMHIGLIFIISGFIFLSIQSGSFGFDSFKKVFESNKTTADILFILFFAGFGIKAGFFPLHTWLPRAHPAAPSPISAIMSGVMIKTGIYGILRVLSWTGTPSFFISYFVLIIALLSGIIGVIYAIAQHDLKKLLAYHSVENIGIIGLGIGVGMLGLSYQNSLVSVLGFSGAVLHVLNHALFKGLLFFGAGAVYKETGTRNIEKLGGLVKAMPFTAAFFLIGSIAISGLPPLNGFISEFLIYFGLFKGFNPANLIYTVILILTIAGLSLIGVMAMLCFTKAFSVVFLGSPRSEPARKALEAPVSMIIPMFIMGLLIAFIGLFPQAVFSFIRPVVMILSPAADIALDTAVLNVLGSISKALFIFIGMFAVVFLLRFLLLRKRKVSIQKTWDCGYQAGTPRIQYTASSFAEPFLLLAKKLIDYKTIIKPPAGLFPKEASLERDSADMIETKAIMPTVSLLNKFLNLFSWIQSGRTQNYLIYGIVFLLLALLFVIGVRL